MFAYLFYQDSPIELNRSGQVRFSRGQSQDIAITLEPLGIILVLGVITHLLCLFSSSR